MPESRPYIVSRHTSTGLDSANAMEPDHTLKNRNADDSGIRCATSYGLQGPKSSKSVKVSRPTWFPKDSAGGGVTNRRREGPSSSGFSKGGYMATLSPKDGREQASKGRSVGLTSASKRIRGELRALIRHPWLQSPG